MSLKALTWAFDLTMPSSSMKFVLVALADNADACGLAWPCIKTICRKTQLNRKTVILALDNLERMGVIKDSGARRGRTMQIKVYQLGTYEEGPNDSEIGTVQTVPNLPSKSPVFTTKESQKRDTEPSGTTNKPNRSKSVWEMTKVIEAKQRVITNLRNLHSSLTANGRRWDNKEAQVEYRRLRSEVDDLTKQLASM
jgi:hypothetical protein